MFNLSSDIFREYKYCKYFSLFFISSASCSKFDARNVFLFQIIVFVEAYASKVFHKTNCASSFYAIKNHWMNKYSLVSIEMENNGKYVTKIQLYLRINQTSLGFLFVLFLVVIFAVATLVFFFLLFVLLYLLHSLLT